MKREKREVLEMGEKESFKRDDNATREKRRMETTGQHGESGGMRDRKTM